MLKLRLEPAIRPGTNEALDRVGATGLFARKKVLEGPREAILRSDIEDIIFFELGEGRWWMEGREKKKRKLVRVESCGLIG